jgi:hypothetical protein
MRRARVLASMLSFLVLAAAAPAFATSVTVEISGTWDSVIDSAGVLDCSVVACDSFTVTLVYDDSGDDQDPSGGFGSYFTAAANSDLSVLTGNYSFSPGSDVGVGVENNNEFGEDQTFSHAEDYTASGLPIGVGTGPFTFADVTLTDSSGTAHINDALVGLNWNLAAYDGAFFHLFVEITGAGPGQQSLDFQGTINQIQILPEPSVTALAGLCAVLLLGLRRRG